MLVVQRDEASATRLEAVYHRKQYKDYLWVLPIYHYTDQVSLLPSLKEQVIGPAEQKAQEMVSPI